MKTFGLWLTMTAVAILAAIIVPYGVLSGGPASLTILLFWGGFALAVVVIVTLGMLGWRR